MTRALATALALAACSMFATSCANTVVVTPPGTGAVTFQWTFNGGLGCVAAGVDVVEVDVAGSSVQFPCFSWDDGGRQGIVAGIPAGSANVTLSGLSNTYDKYGNFSGTVATYSFSGVVSNVVAGENVTAPIDLPLSGTQKTSTIFLLWSFNDQTCVQANIPNSASSGGGVTVTITDPTDAANSVNTAVDCNIGGADGVGFANWAAGSYPFTVTATDATAANVYVGSGTVSVNGITDSTVHVDLAVQSTATGSGSLMVDFTFAGQACAAAGLDHVHVFVVDSTGATVSGTDITPACGSLPETFTGLTAPGTYYLNAQGLNGTTTEYSLLQYEISVYPDATSSYTVDVPTAMGAGL